MAQSTEEGSPQSIFQLVLLAVFGVLGVGGVIVLALTRSFGDNLGPTTPVTIWGPAFAGESVQLMLEKLATTNESFERITYVEKNIDRLYGDILEALATGRAPDMVIIDQTMLLPLKNKLQHIPFTNTFSLSSFRETYVEGAELFVQDEGVYGLPFSVDPLVLFWNRDIFTNAAVASVPDNWDTVVQLASILTKKTSNNDITQSMIAFGEYENVMHAKDILSALFMQAGSSMVIHRENGYAPAVQSEGSTLALSFYTDFANPVKRVYSWNKTFDRSREAFAANKVAMYGGPASEAYVLPEINPNLNFDIAVWPQSATRTNQLTYGKFYAIAKLAQGSTRSFEVMQLLSSRNVAEAWGKVTLLPSARRDGLQADPNNPYSVTMVRSAIMAKGWLEPGAQQTDRLFGRLISDIIAGKGNSATTLQSTQTDLKVLLDAYQ